MYAVGIFLVIKAKANLSLYRFKENNKYKLIDYFGTAVADFSPALNKMEYIDYTVANLYIVKKDDEYEGQFCSIGRVGKYNIVSTINITYSISEVYSDNGIIFVIDENGNFNGYTYMGNKII